MIGDRIKEVRQLCGLTQTAFAARIGIKQPSLNAIERGDNKPSDQTIFIICREFRVNEAWLRDGLEPMRVQSPENEIEQLCERYNLDGAARALIEKFVTLSDAERKIILDFVCSVSAELREEKALDEMTDAEIADAVRRGEQMEKRADARSEA